MNGYKDNMSSVSKPRRRQKSDEELAQIAKAHNFKKVNRFSKDLVYIFETIYTNYAKNLITSLNIRLGGNLNIHLESISPKMYSEFVKTLPVDCVLATFSLEPMKGSCLLIYENNFGYVCVDGLCGGGFGQEVVNREFTDIEKSLLRIVADYFVQPQRYYWKEYLTINPVVKAVDYNPISIQFIEDSESVLIVKIAVEVGDKLFPIQLVFPYLSIENVMEQLFAANYKKDGELEATEESMDIVKKHVMRSDVELRIILGKTTVQLSQVRDLKVGDVLRLDQKVEDLLEVEIENVPRFGVQPGIFNDKMAVQVVELKKQEE